MIRQSNSSCSIYKIQKKKVITQNIGISYSDRGFLQNRIYDILRSSLIYSTSARHQQHECNASVTNATRVQYKQHEYNRSATRATRVRYEWKILILITTRVKTSVKKKWDPYIYYMAIERIQGKKQFHSKNYLSEMPSFHT